MRTAAGEGRHGAWGSRLRALTGGDVARGDVSFEEATGGCAEHARPRSEGASCSKKGPNAIAAIRKRADDEAEAGSASFMMRPSGKFVPCGGMAARG